MAAPAAIFRPRDAPPFLFVLERIERPQSPRNQQINAHNRHRHNGHGGCQRNVARRALLRNHELPDEEAGIADYSGDDVITQCQGKGEN